MFWITLSSRKTGLFIDLWLREPELDYQNFIWAKRQVGKLACDRQRQLKKSNLFVRKNSGKRIGIIYCLPYAITYLPIGSCLSSIPGDGIDVYYQIN